MISKKKKIIYVVFAIIVASIIVAFFKREFINNQLAKNKLSNLNLPRKGERLLIFSLHNDDEVLGTGELIKKSVKNGADVKVVFITNGDGFKQAIEFDYLNFHPKPKDYINFGYTRQKESIAALKSLGLKEDKIIFLGYPDGGIAYLWDIYWDKNNPYTSENMQTNITPYTNSYTKKAIYAGESVVEDIKKIINEYKPTQIIFPHPNDRHPDHWATNSFVKYVMTATNYIPKKELLYLVHRGDWPTPMKRETSLYLVPPAKLVDTGTNWFALNLNNEEVNEKETAINLYKTQIRTLGPLMSGFERKNELFGEYKNIKLSVSKKNKDSIIPTYENKVIIDPVQDAIKLDINKSEDILALYMEKDKEKNLNVFIQIDDKVDKEVKYNLNCVLFYKGNTKRLNLEIKNKEVIAHNICKQSITNIDGLEFNENGKMLHITIPYNVVGDFQHIFVNSNTGTEDKMTDKTAWRMLD